MKTTINISAVLCLTLLTSGCMRVNKEFSELNNYILAGFGNKYSTEAQFAVGSVGISISSWFVDFAQDDDIVNDLMREIDNVQIGIYTSLKETSQVGFNTLLEISADMEARGWKHIVRSIDNGELLAAYISSDIKKTFTQMYIISFDGEQLVIVEVEGNLEELISTVIKEKGIDFNTTFN